MLTARMDQENAYDAAMNRHLNKPPVRLRKPGQSYPRREELHGR